MTNATAGYYRRKPERVVPMCGRFGRITPAQLFVDRIGAAVSPRLTDDAGGTNRPPGTFQACAVMPPDTDEPRLGLAW